MSYCRWSSDDWLSDLYVYESRHGWEVLVAGRRSPQEYRDALALLPDADVTDWRDEQQTRRYFERYFERSQAALELHETFPLEDIDLPHAGDMVTFDTPDEAADACEWLAACGYHVPDGVVDALRSEAREGSERT